jgi:hypothetical protein
MPVVCRIPGARKDDQPGIARLGRARSTGRARPRAWNVFCPERAAVEATLRQP